MKSLRWHSAGHLSTMQACLLILCAVFFVAYVLSPISVWGIIDWEKKQTAKDPPILSQFIFNRTETGTGSGSGTAVGKHAASSIGSHRPHGSRQKALLSVGAQTKTGKLVHSSRRCSRARELCGFSSPRDVAKILDLPHDCRAGGRRFWFLGQWRNFSQLEQSLLKLPTTKKTPPCVVGCVAGDVPCLKEACLLQFYLRPHTSDVWVLHQLYEKMEYEFVAGFELKRILDAGANIGLTSIILANLFPNATIVALEPSATNFKVLLLNVHPYPNVIPLHAALWDSVSRVEVSNPAVGNEWGTMVHSLKSLSQGGTASHNNDEGRAAAPALTIDFVANLFNMTHFDFTKIDIEGAEKEVFTKSLSNRLQWLERVPLVMVEMHDWMKEGSSRPVLSMFEGGDGKYTRIRDYGIWKAWENKALIEQIRKRHSSYPSA